METHEVFCNGTKMWKVGYYGLPGKRFTVREELLFNPYGKKHRAKGKGEYKRNVKR